MYGRDMQTGWPGVRTSIATGIAETFQACPRAHPADCTVGPSVFPRGKAARALR